MKEWKDLELDDLHWKELGGNRYELRDADEQAIATMQRRRWWSTYVEVDAPGNRWSFERKGFWKRHIVIQSVGTGMEPARFDYSNWNGGKLTFADGRVFEWRQSDFWGSKWAWMTTDRQPFLGFASGGFIRMNAALSIAPEARDMPSLALMVFLGWYLLMLHREDTAAVVAAT